MNNRPSLPPDAPELKETLSYLCSEKAIQEISVNAYWPKWNGPWWQMLLLHEMGEAHQIPNLMIEAFVASLDTNSHKIFPIQPDEYPAGEDAAHGCPCHCQLGTVYQVLTAAGVEVDRELPWVRSWLLRYQMADGGLNCDNDAYLVKDEVPSSMVGTIGVFEALVHCTNRPWTVEETAFLDRAARFLIERKLMLGSRTRYNAEEREDEADWLKPTFPRFYFYDVLRGLSALTAWAEKAGKPLPRGAIQGAVLSLESRFPDGEIRIGRRAFEGVGSAIRLPSGEWIRRKPAEEFSLLTRLSQVGTVSPFLTRQWAETKTRLAALGLE